VGGRCIHSSEGWIDMKNDRDECLSGQQVVSYLSGELHDDEQAEVNRHLDECRLCAGAVEGVARLESREDYLRSADSVLTRLRLRAANATPLARPSRSRLWSARQYLALAAAVVVVAGVTVYLTRPAGGEALFQASFELYPSTQPTVRGAATDTSSNALVLYESRDYRGALAAFQAGLKAQPNDATAHFYAGLCLLALGRSAEAITDFEETRKMGVPEFDAPAEWYLALAHLRSENVAEARSRLKRIAERGGFYAEKARVLLAALDRL
jgi:tetratricopeptide (TPR) repeat protein